MDAKESGYRKHRNTIMRIVDENGEEKSKQEDISKVSKKVKHWKDKSLLQAGKECC